MTPENESIQHAESAGRGEFFVEREGKRIAELTYSSSAGAPIVVGHTWVDPRHRGGTLAPRLVDAVVAWAREGDRKIVPACSYVRRVFSRSDKFDDVWSR
jgi:predicted GNAT family acetyltransferase